MLRRFNKTRAALVGTRKVSTRTPWRTKNHRALMTLVTWTGCRGLTLEEVLTTMAQVKNTEEVVEQLLRRPWSRELVSDEGVIAARVPELLGCFAEGATLSEALSNLEGALESWLTSVVELGNAIPPPRGEVEPKTYSGRFSVRVPRSLHRKLAHRAEAENCSVNQLVVSILSASADVPVQLATPANDVREDITADPTFS